MEEGSEDLSVYIAGAHEGAHIFETATFGKLTYCNACTTLLWGLSHQGKKCILCRFVIHAKCEASALTGLPCRPQQPPVMNAAIEPATGHHWVRGNLRGIHSCCACSKNIVLAAPTHMGHYFRCAICTRKVHENCVADFDKLCDGGALGSIIMLPHELQASPPVFGNDKQPMLFFINSKSGANQGMALLRALLGCVNRFQVCDLSVEGPEARLQMFRDCSPPVRVIACGGDGTFGWLQSAIDAVGFQERPPVGHLPLGTGNDMSRSLGFGAGYAGENVKKLLSKFDDASVSMLDRWRVTFDGKSHGYTPAMNNYMGVGIDAEVANQFHKERNANPERFKNRTLNKLKYIGIGGAAMFRNSAASLSTVLELFCDGKPIDLPEQCGGIAILNLPNYASGQRLWPTADDAKEGWVAQDFADGLIEVVSLRGSSDIALAAAGFTPKRLAQCAHLRMELRESVAVQLDGEPWIQSASSIVIEHLNRVPVLVSGNVNNNNVTMTTTTTTTNENLDDAIELEDL